jgi:hypothetical protein
MTEALRLAPLRTEDEAQYTRFLAACPGSTVYHSLAYRDLLVAMLAPNVEYVLAWRGREIVGLLPLMGKAGPAGTVLNSLPFFGSHGDILAVDEEARGALVTWFLDRLQKQDVAAATIIANPFAPASASNWSDSSSSDERISQWTPLPEGPNAHSTLLEMIDGSARRNVRKAETAGVTVREEPTAFEFLEDTHRLNMAEIGGRPKPASFFTAIPQVLRPKHDYRLYVAEQAGEPVAAVLLFYFGQFVEYITPVTRPGSRELQPTAAILYRAMCDAIDEGRRIWNWGGTWLTQDGVYRFKRKWGAHETRYRYTTFVRSPELLRMTQEALVMHYPFFYAFPFSLQATHSPSETASQVSAKCG